MSVKSARLALEDGTVVHGRAFGASSECAGEVVFNTAITGYQEVVTDPSYRGQIVVMTATEIGNVGWNPEDLESAAPRAAGFVVRELSPVVSSWRAQSHLDAVLAEAGVPGIAGVDTRLITRRLRDGGAMRGIITSESPANLSDGELVARVRQTPGLEGRDLVREVTSAARYSWDEGGWQHAQQPSSHE
jgi:carbamoyl-phosphate synthase small subunit